ncbi:sensor histidine kinase [Flaviaesturariibacter terrae]
MKLLAKWSRVNAGVTIVIFLVASLALYASLRFILVEQIDEDLHIEEREIQISVEKHGRLPESISVDDQLIEFAKAPAPGRRHFQTRDLIDREGEGPEKYRQLVFFIRDSEGWHRVRVSKAMEQTDNLIRSIFSIALGTILFILLFSVLINRWAVKRLWRPFYEALHRVGEHKLSADEPLQFAPTQIDEFRMLHESLLRFAGHARREYLSLKTFSENATHELQTPIAVIRSKLDLLLQESQLSTAGVDALQAAFNALERLDRLNRSLLLLARIENKQFSETTALDLTQLLSEKIAEFQELFQQRDLQVDAKLDAVTVRMNGPLCHVLLNNLLSNAWRHSRPGTLLQIRLTAGMLGIANEAQGSALDEDLLFQRFAMPDSEGGGTGLGLALVREICRVSGFSASYRFEAGHHWFTIDLRSPAA